MELSSFIVTADRTTADRILLLLGVQLPPFFSEIRGFIVKN